MKYTVIPYFYRNSNNRKTYTVFALKGELTVEMARKIRQTFEDGESFIPSQVGLPDLQGQMDSSISENDHVWHEIDFANIRIIVGQSNAKSVMLRNRLTPITVLCAVEEFVSRFQNIRWDVLKAIEMSLVTN